MPVLDDGLLHRATCMPFGLDLQMVTETRRRLRSDDKSGIHYGR